MTSKSYLPKQDLESPQKDYLIIQLFNSTVFRVKRRQLFLNECRKK